MKNALRAGITLIEMLVALILLAVLVAIVFPVVTQQLEDADPAKAANDLANIRTAIDVFHLNIRPTYPSDLDDLANPITIADEFLTRDGVDNYTAGHVGRWNGPYIDKSLPVFAGTAPGDALATGFSGIIQNDLIQYDATNNCPRGGGNCTVNFDPDNQIFLAVRVTNLAAAEAERISILIDGNTDLAAGQFRWNDEAVDTEFVGYYLAVPMR